MKQISILLLFLVGFMYGAAQNNTSKQLHVEHAYESFKKDFREEFGENKTPHHSVSKVVTYKPAVKLPDWFFDFSNLYSHQNLSIGISDPGLDSTAALEQAVLRALAIASFSKNCSVQNISDNYYFDHSDSKTIGKFNSFTSCNSQESLGYKVLETMFTDNYEMIVLVETTSDKQDLTHLICNIELFQSETHGALVSKLFLNIEAKNSLDETVSASWMLNENSKSYEIVSLWQASQLTPMKAKFKYERLKEKPADREMNFAFDTKYGLWYAYINALTANMEQMEVFSSRVKFLDDKYDDRFQHLTRIVYSGQLSFIIKNIQISNNHLGVSIISK